MRINYIILSKIFCPKDRGEKESDTKGPFGYNLFLLKTENTVAK